MVAYVWTCHACGSSNPAGSDKCVACGCDAVASRAELERALPELKKRNDAAALAPMVSDLQLICGLGTVVAYLVGGFMVVFSDATLMGFAIAFVGYLLLKLSSYLGKRALGNTPNDAQN